MQSPLTANLQPFIARHELAGAVVLVANKDSVLAVESIGYADIAAHKPMPTNALFWIASQTKPMTVTALMMLVDEGKLHLDDAVEKYLPEFHGQKFIAEQDDNHLLLKAPSHPVIIREILSHTGGFPFSSPLEQPTLDSLPLKVAIGSYAMSPLQTEPGTKYSYSNEGINIAGRIIEAVTGMSYSDFLQTRLLSPLGMTDTTFWPDEEQTERLATSYKPNAEQNGLEATPIVQLSNPLSNRSRVALPAGGLFSTAHDVARFCQMILNGGELEGRRYVSEEAIRQMTSKQTTEATGGSHGLGWEIRSSGYGHGGAYSTNMNIAPQHGLITVYLVQHAGFPGRGGEAQGVFIEAVQNLERAQ